MDSGQITGLYSYDIDTDYFTASNLQTWIRYSTKLLDAISFASSPYSVWETFNRHQSVHNLHLYKKINRRLDRMILETQNIWSTLKRISRGYQEKIKKTLRRHHEVIAEHDTRKTIIRHKKIHARMTRKLRKNFLCNGQRRKDSSSKITSEDGFTVQPLILKLRQASRRCIFTTSNKLSFHVVVF